ncbi:MAG: hypothetical protein AcusKO_20970 [Acuticoccus sp.]
MLDIPGRTSSAVGALDRLFGRLPASELIATAGRDLFPGRVALVSSFGADSVALLHLVASAAPDTPVLFLDTGKHFAETLAYRDALIERLGLTNVINLAPDAAALAARDPDGTLHGRNPDSCCVVRKVRPLQSALEHYDAWFTGRRRDQTFQRREMAVFEADGARTKINPLAGDVDAGGLSTSTSGATSCRAIRWWRRALPRSAARPARARWRTAPTPAAGAGRASTRPSAASTSPNPRQHDAPLATSGAPEKSCGLKSPSCKLPCCG